MFACGPGPPAMSGGEGRALNVAKPARASAFAKLAGYFTPSSVANAHSVLAPGILTGPPNIGLVGKPLHGFAFSLHGNGRIRSGRAARIDGSVRSGMNGVKYAG